MPKKVVLGESPDGIQDDDLRQIGLQISFDE